jgi:hypothetical protein
MASARVSSANTVEIGIMNISNVSSTLNSVSFYITVIQ